MPPTAPAAPAAPPFDPKEVFALVGAKEFELLKLRQVAEREIARLKAANANLVDEVNRLTEEEKRLKAIIWPESAATSG